MKKLALFFLAATLAIFVGTWPGQFEQIAYAAPGGHGVHAGGGHGGGGHGGRSFSGHGGGRGAGGGFRGHGHGGGHFSGGIWIGPGWGWDPFFYPYYSYPYYPYPYSSQPSVVIQQQPQEYIVPEQQPEETSYWYFCKDPNGYYPYVKRCPGGWMRVVPSQAPPGEEE